MTTAAEPLSLFRIASWVVWRLPGKCAMKMAEFSQTEAGSSLDMLEAAGDESVSPRLRKLFLRHALDEQRHAGYFAARARALDAARVRRVLENSWYLHDRGICTEEPLHRRLGEVEFLAFVWVHELRGAHQFRVYAKLLKNDPVSASMFKRIMKDERFHIAYSRRELDRIEVAGDAPLVRRAVRRVRRRRFTDAWLRAARVIGDVAASLWISILFIAVAPFSIFARLSGHAPPRLAATPDGRRRALAGAGRQG